MSKNTTITHVLPTEISEDGRAAYAEEEKSILGCSRRGWSHTGDPGSFRDAPYMGWSLVRRIMCLDEETPITHPTLRKDLNSREVLELFHTQRLFLIAEKSEYKATPDAN